MSEPSGNPQSMPLSTRLFALLKTLQLAIIAMTVFYVLLGELLRRNTILDVSRVLPIIMSAAVIESLAAVYFKRVKIAQVEETLKRDAEDRAALIAARKWYVVALAFCAGVALYGFALRIMGSAFWLAAVFYAAGIALALYCSPRKPE
jgi:hypothetical protein